MKNRMKRWKSVLCIALSVIFVSGCALGTKDTQVAEIVPMEQEEINKFSLNIVGGDDVMKIAGYLGFNMTWYSADGNMFDDYVTEEYAKDIAAAGINCIHYSDFDYATNPDMVIRGLELAEKYNLGYYVFDSYVKNMCEDEEIDLEKLANRVAEYCDYKSFAGVFIEDEPNSETFMPELGEKYISKYKKLCDALHELNIKYHNGGLPCYESEKVGEAERYEAYIQELAEDFRPDILGYDHYPFDPLAKGEPIDLQEHFWNLDLIREYGLKYNLPIEATISAGGQWNDGMERFDSVEYFPNEGQFDWLFNTYLAFGVKAFSVFPLVQPTHFGYAKSTEWDFERNGLFGSMGNKNRWYYYLQDITEHIRAIDGVLMNCVSKGVIASGEKALTDMQDTRSSLIESGKFQELQKVTGDTMVGCFNYNGKTALYVVNYDMEYAQKITLELNASHNIAMIQEAETNFVKGQTIPLDLAAGEGVLLVID